MVVSHRAAVRCPAHSRLSATTRLLVEYHPRHHHRDVGGLRDTGSNGFRYGTSNAPASRPATPGCAAHATKNPGDAGQYRQRYDRRRCCRVVTVTAAAGKFTNLLAGQWIRLLGYAASASVNNNLYRITAMSPSTPATATALTLAAPFNVPVTETPATTTGRLRASQITNGVTFTSLYVQKQLQSGSYYLVYPGSYCTGIQIAGSVGQFVTANFPLLGKKRAPPRPRPVRPVDGVQHRQPVPLESPRMTCRSPLLSTNSASRQPITARLVSMVSVVRSLLAFSRECLLPRHTVSLLQRLHPVFHFQE